MWKAPESHGNNHIAFFNGYYDYCWLVEYALRVSGLGEISYGVLHECQIADTASVQGCLYL